MADHSKDYLQQLAEYIKKNISKGYTLDSLRFSLQAQGYSRVSIENGIKIANEQLAAAAPPMKEKPQISYKLITPDSTYTYENKKGFLGKVFEKLFKRN